MDIFLYFFILAIDIPQRVCIYGLVDVVAVFQVVHLWAAVTDKALGLFSRIFGWVAWVSRQAVCDGQ